MPDRHAPPDNGLPVVETECVNGHPTPDELAWRLPLQFFQDIPRPKMCRRCGSRIWIKAGSYELGSDGVYRRMGPADMAKPVTHWG